MDGRLGEEGGVVRGVGKGDADGCRNRAIQRDGERMGCRETEQTASQRARGACCAPLFEGTRVSLTTLALAPSQQGASSETAYSVQSCLASRVSLAEQALRGGGGRLVNLLVG